MLRSCSAETALSDSFSSVYRNFGWVFVAGCILVIVGTSAYILEQTFALQTLQNISWEASFIAFSSTVSGGYALWRGGLGVVFLLFFLYNRRAINAAAKLSYQGCVLWLLVFAMAFLRARVSHAATSHLLPIFSVFVNDVHLLAKSFWVGGVATAYVVFLDGRIGKCWPVLISKLSRYVSVAFGVAAVSGAYIIWLHLKGFANVFSTDWGYRFLVLSGLALLLFCLRLYNQFWGERKALQLLNAADQSLLETVRLRLRRGYGAEAFMGALMLFSTSLLIITMPPLSSGPLFERHISSEGVSIVFRDSLAEPDRFVLAFASQSQATDFMIHKVILTLVNEAVSIWPIVAELSPVAGSAAWGVHALEGEFQSFRCVEDCGRCRTAFWV